MPDKASILIVDDDANICSSLSKVLVKKGYTITTTTESGQHAIDMVKEKPVDIILMDIKMPVLNGLETYLEIRKANPEAVVVMMTAYRQEMDELVKQAVEKGAYTCLYKPFDMAEAIKIIEEIVKKKEK